MNIERMQPADFDAVYRLLTQSFPATERRGAAGQRALFSDSAYRVDILRAPDGGVQALIASWDFDDFVFLEHFAVDPACRSGGIGGADARCDAGALRQACLSGGRAAGDGAGRAAHRLLRAARLYGQCGLCLLPAGTRAGR